MTIYYNKNILFCTWIYNNFYTNNSFELLLLLLLYSCYFYCSCYYYYYYYFYNLIFYITLKILYNCNFNYYIIVAKYYKDHHYFYFYNNTFKIPTYKCPEATCSNHSNQRGKLKISSLYRGTITRIIGQNSIDSDEVQQTEALIIRERPLHTVHDFRAQLSALAAAKWNKQGVNIYWRRKPSLTTSS